MLPRLFITLFLLTGLTSAYDLESIPQDLTVPAVTKGKPAPGKRVRQFHPEFKDTDLYHILYLPTDWVKGKQYPVIVEYSGNKWKDSKGSVEECDLAYGITAGKGAILISIPYVDLKTKANAPSWWGDVDATVSYCKKTVANVCEKFGGDPKRVVLAGFSRGAIACNYIGLHDDDIASLWCGFICHSHYDGVSEKWDYPNADRKSAAIRLARLGDRPQFISQEGSVAVTKAYLEKSHPTGNFTFLATGFRVHTDTWALRDTPERKAVREWLTAVTKP